MELQKIDGIGDVYQQRLNDAGIRSVADLATASPEVEVPGVPAGDLERFVEQAQQLVGEVPTTPDPTEHNRGPTFGREQNDDGFLTRIWNKLRGVTE